MVTRRVKNSSISLFDLLSQKAKQSGGEMNDILSKPRICSRCNGKVERTVEGSKDQPAQEFSPHLPFEYIFEGCCDEAIDKELAFIQNFVAENIGKVKDINSND